MKPREKQRTYPEIRPNALLSTQEQIGVYSYAWSVRIFESLLEDYPKLAASLGKRAISKLMKDYLQRHPSCSYTLAHVGNRLPEFLKKWENPKKKSWHPDLAGIERGLYTSAFAEDPAPWNIQELLAESQDGGESLLLGLEPTVFLIQSAWNVGQLWVGPETQKVPQKVRSYYGIFRRGFKAELKSFSAREFRILSRIQKGATLGELIDLDPDLKAVEWIVQWSSEGWIRPQKSGLQLTF